MRVGERERERERVYEEFGEKIINLALHIKDHPLSISITPKSMTYRDTVYLTRVKKSIDLL